MGLGAIGLIGGLASTGLSMYGQSQQAKAANQAADYNNALAQREAANLEAETAQGISRERINQKAALADLQNSMAGSGVQTTTGTPLSVVGETAGRFEVGIADAARSASIHAASLRAKGAMGLWEGAQTGAAAKINMFSSGIAGLGSAATKYNEGQYQGLF